MLCINSLLENENFVEIDELSFVKLIRFLREEFKREIRIKKIKPTGITMLSIITLAILFLF